MSTSFVYSGENKCCSTRKRTKRLPVIEGRGSQTVSARNHAVPPLALACTRPHGTRRPPGLQSQCVGFEPVAFRSFHDGPGISETNLGRVAW